MASSHGFQGEYAGEDMTWKSMDDFISPRSQYLYSNNVAAKYHARSIVMHLGMGVSTGTSGLSKLCIESYTVFQNLCNLMAGTQPLNLSIEIQSTAENIRDYSFSLSDGSQLVALWTDGVAFDDDAGIRSTVTIQNISAQKVIGIDVLNGFEQPLIFKTEGTDLVIHDLLVKDYPIFLHLTP